MPQPQKDGPNVTCLGQIVVLLFLSGCLYGAYWLLMRDKQPAGAQTNAPLGP